MPALSSLLYPDEIAEIAASAVKPLSKKKLKRLANALIPELKHGEIQMPAALAADSAVRSHRWDASPLKHAPEPTTAKPEHREKLAPVGDPLDPLVAWYSLVAKPIPRKLWASMPKAQAAIDAEWAKLRACDGGKGTWDESSVCNYWEAQRQAKDKLERTGVHTHTLVLCSTCASGKPPNSKGPSASTKVASCLAATAYTMSSDWLLNFPNKALEPR